ncbi:uncharacterized protein LOC131663282 [Phymastichus coffea]|uniref:uncharacterized protein LOC131663282 n=1 Tax=Phymastichus coffea TaxID=108790 RepID=UPI00273BA920|nr:uncharacterized protein LOC131663282 [Phymastichus coffea]
MGRRGIIRTPEEEQNYQIQKRLRRSENARNRRNATNHHNDLNNEQVVCSDNGVNNQQVNAVVEDYLGQMDILLLCAHCNAKHFASEKVANKGFSFNDCCSHGAVALESTPDFPPQLSTLFDVLYLCENENPAYGQLFFVDQEEALNVRKTQNPHLDQETLSMLDKVIRENNIFAQSYEMMKQEINNQRLEMNEAHEPELQLLFSLKPGFDRRRFNFQRTNEVAAIFSTTADGEIPESYVIIRNKNTKVLQYVSTMDPNVEPWLYPLFYPYGSRGWHKNLERIKMNDNDPSRRVTRMAYTKFKMAVRPDEFNAILLGRRLFQQWVVDAYVKIEKDRIQWCKDNQRQIKSDTYKGLHDYLQNSANDIDGSPRHMQQNYQDAMAIVGKTGKPDIFLTMTCNPRWKEIQENLLPIQ